MINERAVRRVNKNSSAFVILNIKFLMMQRAVYFSRFAMSFVFVFAGSLKLPVFCIKTVRCSNL